MDKFISGGSFRKNTQPRVDLLSELKKIRDSKKSQNKKALQLKELQGFAWDRPESNRRHRDFQSRALPTELQSRVV